METEVKRERTNGLSVNGERRGVVSKSVPPLICVSSYRRDFGVLPSTSERDKKKKKEPAYIFIQPSVLLCL